MKLNNVNEKININDLRIKSIRPLSSNRYNQRTELTSFKNPKNINYFSFYNNNSMQINNKSNKLLMLNKPNKFINKDKGKKNLLNNNKNFSNLSVKVVNLYNPKEQNKSFSIRINDNSPKYYISNYLNQFSLNKINQKNNYALKNNLNNNKSYFSIISPKTCTYKKINFNTPLNKINNNKNNSRIKAYKNINNTIKNDKGKGKENLNCDIYFRMKLNDNNEGNILNSKYNFNNSNNEDINIFQIGKFDNYFYNQSNNSNKNINIKKKLNQNKKNIYRKSRTKDLSIQIQNKKKLCYLKNNNETKLNNKNKNKNNRDYIKTQFLSKLNIKKENESNTDILNNKEIPKDNKNFDTIFDLRNSKFESKTINRIIREFYENENNNNFNDNNNEYNNSEYFTNKNENENIINKNDKDKKILPKNIKKIINNDYKIYLQYNQSNNYIEKIILNDKNGRKTSFIPSIASANDFNTLD